jgi:hypothetical protein
MVRNEERKPGEQYLVFTAPLKEWDQNAFIPGPVKKGTLIYMIVDSWGISNMQLLDYRF